LGTTKTMPDTPGLPPKDTPRPDDDLAFASLILERERITILFENDASSGRVFKWLVGQVQQANENEP
jgi:hypothetical protein